MLSCTFILFFIFPNYIIPNTEAHEEMKKWLSNSWDFEGAFISIISSSFSRCAPNQGCVQLELKDAIKTNNKVLSVPPESHELYNMEKSDRNIPF